MNKKIAAILALLFLSAVVAFSQNIQVKGTVTDANGEPVPFASIQLKGTKTGTATDENGNYTFAAPSNGTLIFSSIGYSTTEVHINGKLIVDCVLNPDTDYLDDVVVVAYGVAKKNPSWVPSRRSTPRTSRSAQPPACQPFLKDRPLESA